MSPAAMGFIPQCKKGMSAQIRFVKTPKRVQ